MEKILVCVSHPMHAQRLIARGTKIAEAFSGEAFVLNVHPRPYDELDFNELQTKNLIQSLAEKHQVALIEKLSGPSPLAVTVAETARENAATQIVLGVSSRGRLESLFGESFVQQLINQHCGVDLHIVQVDRIFWAEPEFDRGQPVWLERSTDGELAICHTESPTAEAEGTFFRWATTEFEDGFFVPLGGGRARVLPVNEGRISADDWVRALQH